LKVLLAAQELGRVKQGPTGHSRLGHEVVKQLVINDVLNEVARHPALIERGVNADEALAPAVAAELDAGALAGARLRLAPPGDEHVAHGAAEVALVHVVQNRLE